MAVTTEKGTKKSAEGEDGGVVSVGNQALLPGAPAGTLKLCLVRSAAYQRCPHTPISSLRKQVLGVHHICAYKFGTSLLVAVMVRSLSELKSPIATGLVSQQSS